MKTQIIASVTVLSLFLAGAAWGQRTLQSDESLRILKDLTSQPRRTWIAAGTIEAVHREYGAPKTTDSTQIAEETDRQIREYQANTDKVELTEDMQKMRLDAIPFNVRYRLANEFTMSSHVIVRYDGERFYWEINVDSRQDSVVPDASVAGNSLTDQFDLSFNRRRIFAWDGDKYTVSTASGKCTAVDTTGRWPRAVSGPLTAGLIPWGYGRFTYDALSQARVTASEVNSKDGAEIQMTLAGTDGSAMSFTLDPSKDYAVTACTLPGANGIITSYGCSGYRQIGGAWIPYVVSIERRDAFTDRLLGSEQWTFANVRSTAPSPASFIVNQESDTSVEYFSDVTDEPVTYIQSYSVDTAQLLADRLTYAVRQGRQPQNCATAAVGYVASELGKPIPADALARLVGPDGQTTMYAMKQFVQGLGLYCRAVRTDLAALRDVYPAKAILHIPGKNHFVVLDSVDDRDVRIIDLSSNKFYYRHPAVFFPMEWFEGAALLISAVPVTGPYNGIDDARLAAINAGGYACTKVIQKEYYYTCAEGCTDYFAWYFKRYGCQSAPQGSCTTQQFIRYWESPCIPDPIYECTITGDLIFHYMGACQ